MTSPPTCVSGINALTASRTNLIRRLPWRARARCPVVGYNSHQPTPETATVTARVSTTNGSPQPALATASPIASMPHHKLSPLQTAIATHHDKRPTCLNAPSTPSGLSSNFTRFWGPPKVSCASYATARAQQAGRGGGDHLLVRSLLSDNAIVRSVCTRICCRCIRPSWCTQSPSNRPAGDPAG